MEPIPPRFKRFEVVRVRDTPASRFHLIAGLSGVIAEDGERNWEGRWHYSVNLPRRRHRSTQLTEDELEGTGRFEVPEGVGDGADVRLRVDPGTGDGSVLAEDGEEIEIDIDNGAAGVAFFSCVQVLDPDAGEDDDLDQGVIVAKGRHPDGRWRYAVLLQDERRVTAHERIELDPAIWLDPAAFLDAPRPTGIDEFERSETLPFVAAWRAPRPAFGYDQRVRVLARAHTDAIADREGAIRMELLGDDLTWSYLVIFDDDPAAPVESATVGEDDLEATGGYGEGYNPPPDWLG